MKTTFKLNEIEKNEVIELANKLLAHGVKTWIRLNPNNMAECKWRFITSRSPNIFITSPMPIVNGGIGALLGELREACFAHGIMKRPERIGTRNHVRLAINGNPVWTTSNGG